MFASGLLALCDAQNPTMLNTQTSIQNCRYATSPSCCRPQNFNNAASKTSNCILCSLWRRTFAAVCASGMAYTGILACYSARTNARNGSCSVDRCFSLFALCNAFAVIVVAALTFACMRLLFSNNERMAERSVSTIDASFSAVVLKKC